jgi:DNA uptake protein ComE-like DNA-binding protein
MAEIKEKTKVEAIEVPVEALDSEEEKKKSDTEELDPHRVVRLTKTIYCGSNAIYPGEYLASELPMAYAAPFIVETGKNKFTPGPNSPDKKEIKIHAVGSHQNQAKYPTPPPVDVKNPQQKVNINQGSVVQLSTIPGVGHKIASTIIEERGKEKFTGLEDLSERVKLPAKYSWKNSEGILTFNV